MIKSLKVLLLALPFSVCILFVNGQAELSGTVRGRILDDITQATLPGASVVVVNSEPIIGTVTDIDGRFVLENVPVGRQTFKVTFLGYEPRLLQNIEVTSSRELVLNVAMTENIEALDEVVITGEQRKDQTINEMATVSARTFSVEESERYAGTINDVSRMASNFAGVRSANDANNDIIIRGNSPAGLLWRFEDIDIPNPNHFGDLGATGGPVSMLNTNMLANSDFMTAAFPADYGNALSGVFDLKMRKGNDQKFEFLGQVGFNGFELAAEGPLGITKGSSFLIDYRLSTLEVMQKAGFDFGTGAAVPNYQDLTFNIDIPTKKAGTFQLFGLAGISKIEFIESTKDTTGLSEDENLFVDASDQDIYDWNRISVAGFSYKKLFGKKTLTKITLSANEIFNTENLDTLDALRQPIDFIDNKRVNRRLSGHAYVKHKFSPRLNTKSGVIYTKMLFDFKSELNRINEENLILSEEDGGTDLAQAYSSWQLKLGSRWTVNAGVYGQYLAISEDYAVEPRAGVRFELRENMSLNAGYGLHSRMQVLPVYFQKRRNAADELVEPNRDLGFTKAHHAVIGHDWQLPRNMRLKTETYYQHIFDAPVSNIPSSVSLLNLGAPPGGFPDSLEFFLNEGEGRNYGLEFTLEKFLTKGFYFLTTVSLYKSEYRASDDIWRSTAFDGGYVANGLAGKEIHVGKNKKFKANNYLVIDGRYTYAGGQRYIPIDLAASNLANDARYALDEGYSGQFTDYWRADINIGYKRVGKKTTQEWTLVMQNITGRDNAFFQRYNPNSGEAFTVNQLGFFAVPQYRITF